MGRADTHNRLLVMQSKKSFTNQFIKLHKHHPEVATVKCYCHGKKTSISRGCTTEGFIWNAHINHFLACLQADKNPTDIYLQAK